MQIWGLFVWLSSLPLTLLLLWSRAWVSPWLLLLHPWLRLHSLRLTVGTLLHTRLLHLLLIGTLLHTWLLHSLLLISTLLHAWLLHTLLLMGMLLHAWLLHPFLPLYMLLLRTLLSPRLLVLFVWTFF